MKINIIIFLLITVYSSIGFSTNTPESDLFYGVLKSAELGNSVNQKKTGDNYYLGRGIEQNYSRALYWYKKAAFKGITSAKRDIGLMYLKGEGVRKDIVQSYKWIFLASLSSREIDKYTLSTISNQLTEAQKKEAKKESYLWLYSAAKTGEPYSQLHLAILYRTGQGVKKDLVEALKWVLKSQKVFSIFSKAMPGIDDEVNAEYKLLTSMMTSAQIKQAVKLASSNSKNK